MWKAYIVLIVALAILVPLYYLVFKKKNNIEKIQKIISVVLFIAVLATLYYDYAIDTSIKLNSYVFSPFMLVLMVFIRWFTSVATACAIFYPYYKNNYFKKICEYILPVVALLNVVFLIQNFEAMYGPGYNIFFNYRTYGFIIQIILLVYLSFIYLEQKISNREFNDKAKDILIGLMIFGLLMLAFMPQTALTIFFGSYGQSATDFNPVHRISLYITAAFLILPYIFLRDKSTTARNLFFAILSYAALVQYFYEERSGLGGLPLHLCNTAVVLMFVAFVFRLKGIFYFTYFVNVLGALFAIFLPNISSDVFSLQSVHFWYNHVYAVVLPLLGVALRVYERPTLNMMYRAIGFFALYFLTVITINAWFNNYESVDYFFSYGDFFVEKWPSLIAPIKNPFTWELPVGGLVFKFFPVFQSAIFVGYIALMFIMWVIYYYLYNVSDRHYALLMIKKQKQMDVLNLKELYKGQDLNEPLNKEAMKMIKIEHFTKKYAGSKKPSVDDFSLQINDGEVFGFLGHNGAGKSTTIKSMVGIQSITSGNIIIDGYDIKKQPLEAKLRIGYVSDNHAVYEKLTGREYINYVADLYLVSQEDREERIKKYVEMFNLTDAIDREIKGYSHGMKQKIVVIASLIHNPKVWILDEPLTGLDPTSAFQIKECMRDHANNGNIVFFSSHVIEVVEKICDKICIIAKGKLVGVYNLKELASQGMTLEELYMKHVAQANYNTSFVKSDQTVLEKN